MSSWTKYQGQSLKNWICGGTNRNQAQDGKYSVPSWEKKFCFVVGSMPWIRLLEAKKNISKFDNVMKWDDSAGKKAFHDAKRRFWAKFNGFPCNIPLPDPDIYIDKIDWDSKIDPQLLLDVEVAID